MKEIATQIKAQLTENGIEIQLSEIEAKLDLFINKFGVHSDEARRNVINFF